MVSVRNMVPLAVALLCLSASLEGCGGGGGDDKSNSLASVAEKTADLSTLVEALKSAGMVENFSATGPFTVFAPSNEAFKGVPAAQLAYLLHNKAALAEVLQYHVAPGSVLSSDLKDGEKIKTLEGHDVVVAVTKGANATVKINNATVTTADLKASNGVIHIIDTVLLPPGFAAPTIADLAASQKLNTLLEAVKAADLATTLSGKGPFTVFAPDDAAFKALPSGVLDSLLKPENIKDLTAVLKYHIVSAEDLGTDLKNGEHLKTLEGHDLNVTVSGADSIDKANFMYAAAVSGAVSINKAKVTHADVCAGNGVIHVIDAVLLPPGFVPPTPGPLTCPGKTMEGIDCDTGKNIKNTTATSEDDCCKFCLSVKGCKVWTWNKDRAGDLEHHCYAKTDCGRPNKTKGVVSGILGETVEVTV